MRQGWSRQSFSRLLFWVLFFSHLLLTLAVISLLLPSTSHQESVLLPHSACLHNLWISMATGIAVPRFRMLERTSHLRTRKSWTNYKITHFLKPIGKMRSTGQPSRLKYKKRGAFSGIKDTSAGSPATAWEKDSMDTIQLDKENSVTILFLFFYWYH